ncbi:hypothetical protein [Lactiplantibacillus fabifermentans]|nr:hypothetical protein [Lactiplantibacillus fabifermentans]ETY72829.1 hypothetical protein LFAB_15595 [Lactiplantibacillus fabifermentans T30PCM01]
MKKVKYSVQPYHENSSVFSHQAQQKKQALVAKYHQQHQSVATPMATKHTKTTVVAPDLSAVKQENRKLKRQLAQLKERQVNKQQTWQQRLQQSGHERRQLMKQLATTNDELDMLQSEQASQRELTAELTTQLQQSRQFVTGASAWLAQSQLLYRQAMNILNLATIQRKAQNKPQRLTLKQAQQIKMYHVMKPQIIGLNKKVNHLSAQCAELVAVNERLRRKSHTAVRATQPLKEQVMNRLEVTHIHELAWLPDVYHCYQTIMLEDVLVNGGNRVFGYFIRTPRGYYFQVVGGRAYAHHRRIGSAKKELTKNAVYAGIIDGNRVLLTSIYQDITPTQLRHNRDLQLHRRHARSNYDKLLPVAANQKLTGRSILIVTWQRSQRLQQMFEAFGMKVQVVNDHEKSINWIATAALSKRFDYALLLSEGLSHSLLATIGKDTLKQRSDIELVYNESPEELLRRCYRFFSTQAL